VVWLAYISISHRDVAPDLKVARIDCKTQKSCRNTPAAELAILHVYVCLDCKAYTYKQGTHSLINDMSFIALNCTVSSFMSHFMPCLIELPATELYQRGLSEAQNGYAFLRFFRFAGYGPPRAQKHLSLKSPVVGFMPNWPWREPYFSQPNLHTRSPPGPNWVISGALVLFS